MIHQVPNSRKKSICFWQIFLSLVLLSPLTVFSEDKPQAESQTGGNHPIQAILKTSTDQAGESTTEGQIQDSMGRIESIHQLVETLRKEIDSGKESDSATRSRMKNISETLQLIDNKLIQAYSGLDDSKGNIKSNAETINKVREDINNYTRDIRTNAADLGSQKSLIEDNSIRLYEILIQLGNFDKQLNQYADNLEGSQQSRELKEFRGDVNVDLNRLWMMLSTVLVFFAPLAFVLSSSRGQPLLADGTEQQQGMLLATLGVFLGYFVLGFGLMYGQSVGGWVGIPVHLLDGISTELGTEPRFSFTEFVLYKTGFAMLGALIVYVAIGSQLTSAGHMLMALFVGAILIPTYGHWVTSGHFIPTNKGWLESIGFVDQAGAMTINTVAGWFAFIIAWRMKPLHASSTDPNAPKKPDEPVYSSSATLLLWLSWGGFTTGTLPISSDEISNVMLNAGLAASAGGMTAFLQYVFFNSDRGSVARGLGGFVSGLVAIAACAQSVTFIEAAFIGAVAGLIQNLAYSILRRSFLTDDWQVPAAYLVAIHGVAGIWGALCFALLGSGGSFGTPNFIQLGTQIQGIAAAVIYSIFMANIVLFFMKSRKKKPAKTKTVSTVS
jgi:Amt family ammonium transporter